MKTIDDLTAFEDFAAKHHYEITGPRNWSGWAVAWDKEGRARARCWVTSC